jgi:hypothetical protein
MTGGGYEPGGRIIFHISYAILLDLIRVVSCDFVDRLLG